MSFSRPIQWYHSHPDLIWPDGTFNAGQGVGPEKNDKNPRWTS